MQNRFFVYIRKFSKGYVVEGKDTADFLREKLLEIGLYTENAKLNITPNPDSMLRVFMAYKKLEEPIEIEEPVIEPFERKGFTVIEWGGAFVE